MNLKTTFLLLIGITLWINNNVYAQPTKKIDLKKYKRIDEPARDEVSGIVKDFRYEDVYWVHGDSGTKNKIYAVNEKGEMLPDKDSKGLEIIGIKNKDWEDITIDSEGNILIADVGNNCSCRSDQTIIRINSPDTNSKSTEDSEVIKVIYEKPEGFLYRFLNYSMDVEAVFWKEGSLFVLTKRFRGRETKLFRLDTFTVDEVNEFKLVQKIDFDDEVTAADYAFGKLAVLTYKSLWIFPDNDTDDFFDGDVLHFEFEADQVESVAFIDAQTVVIVEENGDMYKVEL